MTPEPANDLNSGRDVVEKSGKSGYLSGSGKSSLAAKLSERVSRVLMCIGGARGYRGTRNFCLKSAHLSILDIYARSKI